MSLLPGRVRASSSGELVLGGVVVLGVLALTLAAPGQAGMLFAAVAVAGTVAYIAFNDPLIAIILVMASSFFRLAQKEIVSIEALTPAVLVLLAALALAVSRGTRRAPKFGAVEWLMAVYLVWNVLSWLLPHQYEAIDPLSGESQDVYRWILTGVILPFLIYVVAKSVLDTERSVRWMFWAVVAMAGYSSWVSILQFHGPKALIWPKYIVNSPNWVGRANGVFNQPVVNGVILDIGFLTCLFLASRPGTRRSVRFLLYGLALANAYSVYLTHTRVALLVLVITLVLGMMFAEGWRRAFVWSTVLGLAAVAANAATLFTSNRATGGVGSSYEVYDRLNIMATSFRAIAEHPFVGIGIGRFLIYNTYEHVQWSQDVEWNRGYNLISHENDLGIAAELGIPGALAWLAVLASVLWLLWRAMRELPRDEFMGAPLALVGAIAMVSLVVNGLTVDLRLLEFATMVPFLYAGIVVGQLERHREHRADLRPGLPGGGLPGGMSPDAQQQWRDHDRTTSTRQGDPRLQPAR